MCDTSNSLYLFYLIKMFLKIILIVTPSIIVISASIKLFKLIISNSISENFKENIISFLKSIIAGLILFMIPTIVPAIFKMVGYDTKPLYTCMETSSLEKVNELRKKEAEIKEQQRKKEQEEQRKLLEQYDEEAKKRKKMKESDNNLKGNAWVNNLLSEAKEITDYIYENDFHYGDAPINPAFNHDAKLASCDRCVDWFLYNVGFTDQPYEQGLVVRDMAPWLEEQGFKKIDNQSDLKAGDIVFTNPEADGVPAHVFLLGNPIGDGVWERYDCGSEERMRLTEQYSSYSSQPFQEEIANFVYAYRAPQAQ